MANGNQLQFYINNVKVWQAGPTAFDTGIVGMMYYREFAGDQRLMIDWAKVTTMLPVGVSAEPEASFAAGTPVEGGTPFNAP